MSRNAQCKPRAAWWCGRLFSLLCCLGILSPAGGAEPAVSFAPAPAYSRVVVVHHPGAIEAYEVRAPVARSMVVNAITNLTRRPTEAAAWTSLVKTSDVVGLKVHSSPGARSGTRPAVVEAVVQGLLAAGVRSTNIIVWDRHLADLLRAGYRQLANRYGIGLEGSDSTGYDEAVYYEKPFLGALMYGDVEFGRQGDSIGRKSFVSKLVSQRLTKIINITPLLNHYRAGVTGNLCTLALGSVDNTHRFETEMSRLAEAVPEIYALEAVGDKVVLSIVDALVCQYQGEQVSLLHYSTVLNELRFSTDPVALDVLSLMELERHRPPLKGSTNVFQLYENAAVMDLGIADQANIRIERFN